MKRILTATVMVVLVAFFGGFATSKADAVSAQQSVKGIVDGVYWDLDTFWGSPQRKPGVGYYNHITNGQLVHYQTSCGPTRNNVGTQGFYCYGGDIHLDWTQQTGNLRNIGDGAVALWLAHEYGHHAEWVNRISLKAPYQELMADCFAGLYFRWGVYESGKLAYNDYLEARSALSRLGSSSSHGTSAQRMRAFDFGFKNIGWRSCYNGWQNFG